MNKAKRFIIKHFMADELPFESRTLNFACILSFLAGTAALVSRVIAGLPLFSTVSLLVMNAGIVGVLLMSGKRIKHVTLLTAVIVFCVSLIFWPFHFYTIGGPNSGMAVYFAMAMILDFMLLKGKPRVVAIAVTCAVTIFCYVSTIFLGWPVFPTGGLEGYQLFIDIMQSIFIVGFLMGAIILYQTKLYQNEKRKAEAAHVEIKNNEELMTFLNESSVVLLTAEPDNFEKILSKSMNKIAEVLEIDCIYIWRTTEREGVPVYEKLYNLLAPNSSDMKTVESVSGTNVIKRVSEWDDKLLHGKGFISETKDRASGYLKALMDSYGMMAITAFPVFFKEEYWGFVSFDSRNSERLCSEQEAAVLRSCSMLLANAVERNENMIRVNSTQLTMSSMFEINPHINMLFDSGFKMIDCNPAALKFMGFETKEEMRAGFLERLTKGIPEFQSGGRRSIPLAERFMTTLKEGFVRFATELVINGDERNIDVEFQKIPYENSFAIVAFVFDMTEIHEREVELKKAVQALETAQRTVSTMFESNPQINILFDSSFQVIDCNPTAIRYMGFDSKEDMIAGFTKRLAESVPETLSSGRQKRSISEWFMDAVTKGAVKFETEFVLSGIRRSVEIELKKIPYSENYAIVGYILDMTEIHAREMELKRRDQQLSEAVQEAKSANEAKSSFLSTMSHEIRTPMNAIIGITEILLQNPKLEQEIREGLSKIHTSGDMLLGIINDILDLSKIEAGKLELIIDKYEIASLISDTAQLNMMRIGSKPIEFELYVDENAPVLLLGDELRVKQIMNNILSNAFKYTAVGTVTLSINIEPGNDNDNVTLIISISDTGQGMTKEQVEKLFDQYTRFNMEANRSTEGTGLGMSITRNLLRLMNGDIHVESEPGKGSTFTVRLPQGKVGSGVLGKEMADNLHNFRTSSRTQMRRVQITREPMPYGRVLIVDDVETNIYVAKGLLTPYELKIDSVDSGFGAIEKIKNGCVYDIVFMDHMMPKMDGIEATKIIRGMGYDHPIVALTANAVAGQADIFLGNGFDDYISKPIDVRQLNAVLNKLIRDKHSMEHIKTAVKQEEFINHSVDGTSMPLIDPYIAEIFVRDAQKIIAALDAIDKKRSYDSEEDLRTYVIHVHGIKSALANIGNMELSAIALKLEVSARDKNIKIIQSETPDFLDALKEYVKKLMPQKEKDIYEETYEDIAFLRENLFAIKNATDDFDDVRIDNILMVLKTRSWSKSTDDLLREIAENSLHSDFDKIVEIIEKYIGE